MAIASEGPHPSVDEVVRSTIERLMSDYSSQVPEATVMRCVDAARHAVRFFGEEPSDLPRVLERIARADLEQIVNGRDSGARIYGVHRPGRASLGPA